MQLLHGRAVVAMDLSFVVKTNEDKGSHRLARQRRDGAGRYRINCNSSVSVRSSFSGKCAVLFDLCLTVWGVEQDVTHQTSWLGSTQENVVCHKAKLVKLLLKEEPNTAVGNLDQTEKSVAP